MWKAVQDQVSEKGKWVKAIFSVKQTNDIYALLYSYETSGSSGFL